MTRTPPTISLADYERRLPEIGEMGQRGLQKPSVEGRNQIKPPCRRCRRCPAASAAMARSKSRALEFMRARANFSLLPNPMCLQPRS